MNSPTDDRILDSALTRLARDAERGVDTARKAIEDKSPKEAADYFAEKLTNIDQSREAIVERMDQDEVQISREAAELFYRTGRIDEAEQAVQRIFKLLPNDLDATNRLGHIYHLRGDLPPPKSSTDACSNSPRKMTTYAPPPWATSATSPKPETT